jgi:hypothetical protein
MAFSAACAWLGFNASFVCWRVWVAKAHSNRVHIIELG